MEIDTEHLKIDCCAETGDARANDQNAEVVRGSDRFMIKEFHLTKLSCRELTIFSRNRFGHRNTEHPHDQILIGFWKSNRSTFPPSQYGLKR